MLATSAKIHIVSSKYGWSLLEAMRNFLQCYTKKATPVALEASSKATDTFELEKNRSDLRPNPTDPLPHVAEFDPLSVELRPNSLDSGKNGRTWSISSRFRSSSAETAHVFPIPGRV